VPVKKFPKKKIISLQLEMATNQGLYYIE
jgi:hypothetical protein